MRREAQGLPDSRPSNIKRLTDQWRGVAQESLEANLGVDLPLKILAQLASTGLHSCMVFNKLCVCQQDESYHGLAAHLQLETADLELQLASPAGQRVLLSNVILATGRPV